MKKKIVQALIFSFFIFHFSIPTTAQAEPVTQSFTINPGWNAIFLEVEPTDPDPAVVFASLLDLTSVWMWNPRTGLVEFTQDPGMPIPEGAGMLVYEPGNPIVTNLLSIHGNTAYLINYGGAAPSALDVTGEPLLPQITWKPNSFNFVGFHVDSSPPLFENFFSSSPAHAGQEIFVLDNATGNWVAVTASDLMQEGEGFWIYCKGSSEFAGPTTMQLNQGKYLQYGTVLEHQEIRVKNDSEVVRTVELGLIDGVPGYPLYYWKYDVVADVALWEQITQDSASLILTINPGESQTVKMGVKRIGLIDGTNYTTNLQVKDGDVLFKVPVSVTGVSNAGLWVGEATINKVNQPSEGQDNVTPTGSEFSYRLIIHVNSGGQARLLNQVIQMWQEGTWKSDPTDLSKQIVDQPGTFVLIADDALISKYSGASLRDGQPVGRRISSAAFGNLYDTDNTTKVHFKNMTGAFAGDNSTLAVNLHLPMDDATNPFVHKYHPSHRVPPDERTNVVFNIDRAVTMTFKDTDSDGNPILGSTNLGWGSTVIGGVYRETIQGLLRATRDIKIEGTFTLHRVSNVDTLTTN